MNRLLVALLAIFLSFGVLPNLVHAAPPSCVESTTECTRDTSQPGQRCVTCYAKDTANSGRGDIAGTICKPNTTSWNEIETLAAAEALRVCRIPPATGSGGGGHCFMAPDDDGTSGTTSPTKPTGGGGRCTNNF